MMPRQYIHAVCEYFQIIPDQIRGESRKAPLPLARKILIHLLCSQSTEEIQQAVNRSQFLIYQYRAEMARRIQSDYELARIIREIETKVSEMTLNLNKSQLTSLFEVLTDFLMVNPKNVEAQLIAMHMDDVREKVRKRIRAGKENLGLDEKQLRAFVVFHIRCSPRYESVNPHGYMTLMDIIQQIKPESMNINLIN